MATTAACSRTAAISLWPTTPMEPAMAGAASSWREGLVNYTAVVHFSGGTRSSPFLYRKNRNRRGSTADGGRLRHMVARRLNHDPHQQLYGQQWISIGQKITRDTKHSSHLGSHLGR